MQIANTFRLEHESLKRCIGGSHKVYYTTELMLNRVYLLESLLIIRLEVVMVTKPWYLKKPFDTSK
jgi:hypothetical protein